MFKLSWFPLLTLPLLLLDHTDERKWRTAWVAGVMGLVSLFFFFFLLLLGSYAHDTLSLLLLVM